MKTISLHGTTFHRIADTPTPTIPDTGMSMLAVSIGVPLTSHQADRLAGLAGYVCRAHLNSHQRLLYDLCEEHPDVLVFADVDNPARTDPVSAWSKVVMTLEQYVREGTPIRKTDRAGQGTKGTRLVEGFGEQAAGRLRVYADQAVDLTSAAFLQAMSGTPTSVTVYQRT